jgi:hypothetical protein
VIVDVVVAAVVVVALEAAAVVLAACVVVAFIVVVDGASVVVAGFGLSAVEDAEGGETSLLPAPHPATSSRHTRSKGRPMAHLLGHVVADEFIVRPAWGAGNGGNAP